MDIGRSLPIMSGSPYMTRIEAAQYARVSPKTIDRWRADPTSPVKTHGNKRVVLVRRDEIDAHLAGEVLTPAA